MVQEVNLNIQGQSHVAPPNRVRDMPAGLALARAIKPCIRSGDVDTGPRRLKIQKMPPEASEG